jgi:hypothetical protein
VAGNLDKLPFPVITMTHENVAEGVASERPRRRCPGHRSVRSHCDTSQREATDGAAASQARPLAVLVLHKHTEINGEA